MNSKRAIRAKAEELLQRAGVTSAPVPVRHLAEVAGAVVRSGPLSDDISGFLLYEGDKAVIGVNSLHARARQRFTIAHECGHLLLHRRGHSYLDRAMVIYRDSKSAKAENKEEIEANAFAAELLMPVVLLDAMIDWPINLHDEDVLEDLADRLGVSVLALTYRLTNLRAASRG